MAGVRPSRHAVTCAWVWADNTDHRHSKPEQFSELLRSGLLASAPRRMAQSHAAQQLHHRWSQRLTMSRDAMVNPAVWSPGRVYTCAVGEDRTVTANY
jgi:hypothetical protein